MTDTRDPFQDMRTWIVAARLGGDITAADAAARLSKVEKAERDGERCPDIRYPPLTVLELDVDEVIRRERDLSESSDAFPTERRWCVACGSTEHYVEDCSLRDRLARMAADERGGEYRPETLAEAVANLKASLAAVFEPPARRLLGLIERLTTRR